MQEPLDTTPRFPFVLVDVSPEDAELLTCELFELGAQGVEERDASTLVKNRTAGLSTLSASFATRADAEEAVAALDPALSPVIEEVIGDGWRDAWKEHFKPFFITPHLVVRPPWVTLEDTRSALALEAEHPGVRIIELEPGRAFGTGLHETTRLVAEALDQLPLEGQRVLDVGTGSGILALLALLRGASHVRGIDNDPEAIEVSLENTARNGLEQLSEFSTDDVSEEKDRYPLVLANIETHILVPMAAALKATVAPGGHLLLSGILHHQEAEILAAYADDELSHHVTSRKGEWVLVHLERRA